MTVEDTMTKDPGRRPYHVLFLCTGNSARSILAEALLNHWGRGRFNAFSAGSAPTGRVNPEALRLLAEMNIPAAGARSKSWDEFAVPGAPEIDFVITVCSNAAGEACPLWPGRPTTAHWGVDDPAAVSGTQQEITAAFRRAYEVLEHRVKALTALPPASLERAHAGRQLADIGESLPPTQARRHMPGHDGSGA
jgi:arsenate reductase